MRRQFLFCVIVASLLFSGNIFGNEITVEEILDRMQEKEEGIKDISLKFSQTMEFLTVKEKYFIEGELIFKHPKRLLHKQVKPREQYIVSDGKRLFIYNPFTKQVYVDKWKNWKGIDYFLPGVFHKRGEVSDLRKYFNIDLKDIKDGVYELHIVPLEKKKVKKRLPKDFEFYMWVNKESLLPEKSKFISDSVICITKLTNITVNSNPDDEIFKFKIPEDAEVFELK